MTNQIFPGLLALPIAFHIQRLALGEEKPQSKKKKLLGFLLVWYFVFTALWFFWPVAFLKDNFFPPPLGALEGLEKLAAVSLFGALALAGAVSSRRAKAFALGAALGCVYFLLAWAAYEWIPVVISLKLLESFWGPTFEIALPWLLATGLLLSSGLILHEDFRAHSPILVAPLIGVIFFGAFFCKLWLSAYWGYGPANLAEAFGLAPASGTQTVMMMDLRPAEGLPYRVEERELSLEGITLTSRNLVNLYVYLRQCRYQSIFAAQAVRALRKGWLLWWDESRALEAAALSYPSRMAPDYVGALAFIRAGPITMDRFHKLQALSRVAQINSDGIGDIDRAQSVFEAFEAAYARFNDAPGARYWLSRLDNLQIVSIRNFSVAPLEPFIDGKISGSIQMQGPGKDSASSFVIGLFFISSNTTGKFLEGALSQTTFPDAKGRFSFRDLGRGRYYLALMGTPALSQTRIKNVPGVMTLQAKSPSLALKPILLTAPKIRAEPAALKPFDILFSPP